MKTEEKEKSSGSARLKKKAKIKVEHAVTTTSKRLVDQEEVQRNRRILIISAICTGALVYVYFQRYTPDVGSISGCANVKGVRWMVKGTLPTWLGGRNAVLDTVKDLWKCAEAVKNDHWSFVLGAYIAVYVSLQAFAIPGPLILSLLTGALYPFWYGQLLIAFCATSGASICYGMSHMLGKPLANHYIPDAIEKFRAKVHGNRENLFWYMLFLRLTPLLSFTERVGGLRPMVPS